MFNPDPKPVKKEKDRMSAREFRNNYTKKEPRIKSTRQTYNGYSYQSTLEARYAAKLDMLIKAGEVKKWERQHKIELIVSDVRCGNYYVDFKVWLPDGRVEYHEVKGAESELWRLKWKIAKALHPYNNFVLIKKVK